MAGLADEPGEGLGVADHREDVAGDRNRVVGGHVDDAGMARGVAAHDAGEHEVVAVLLGEGAEVGQPGALDADGHAVEGRRRVVLRDRHVG